MWLRKVGPALALYLVGACAVFVGLEFGPDLVSEESSAGECQSELIRLTHAGFSDRLSCRPEDLDDPNGPTDLHHD